jgi:hypothetical protein
MILIDDAQTTIIQSTVIASLVKMLERQEASTAAKTLGTLAQYGMFLVNSSLFPLIVSVDEARTIIIHLNTMSLLGKMIDSKGSWAAISALETFRTLTPHGVLFFSLLLLLLIPTDDAWAAILQSNVIPLIIKVFESGDNVAATLETLAQHGAFIFTVIFLLLIVLVDDVQSPIL